MDAAPARNEGELSKTRAGIVNESGLADVAGELGLGEWLFLGRGEEQSGGRRKPSVRDRIRLTGLLRESPAPAGLSYFEAALIRAWPSRR